MMPTMAVELRMCMVLIVVVLAVLRRMHINTVLFIAVKVTNGSSEYAGHRTSRC